MMSIIIALLIGILSGFVAGKIIRGTGFGMIVNLIVGIIGSFVGAWLFKVLDWHINGILGTLLMSIIGAIVFILVVSFFAAILNTNR